MFIIISSTPKYFTFHIFAPIILKKKVQQNLRYLNSEASRMDALYKNVNPPHSWACSPKNRRSGEICYAEDYFWINEVREAGSDIVCRSSIQ